MNKKLIDKVCHIHCEDADSCTSIEDCAVLQAIRQAFQDAGWIEPKQDTEFCEHGISPKFYCNKCIEKELEPQQPEGELAECPAKTAQLAHDKEIPELGNLKICPKCGIWCLEFDPHQQAWKCLNKECSAIYRNGVPEIEPQHFKFSEVMEISTLVMRPPELHFQGISPSASGAARGEAMNKQFDKLLGGCPGCPLYLSDLEQQVWLAAQKAMLEVGYRKPYPAEGGLVPNPHKEYVNAECLYEDWLEDDHRKERFCEDLRHSGFQEGSQAQRAFDLATMVTLPSEDDLDYMIEDCSERDKSGEVVKIDYSKLLGLLKEQKP